MLTEKFVSLLPSFFYVIDSEEIFSLGEVNGRMMNFYDICTISEKRDMDGTILQSAIIETFHHWNISFDEIVAFDEEFCEDSLRATRWRGFLKQKNVLASVDFRKP